MKKILQNSIILFLLTVYTVFSTGIVLSIHHCCSHCHQKVEKIECLCHHDEKEHECKLEEEHHRCHDEHLFLKILEEYSIVEHKFSFSPILLSICHCEHYKEIYNLSIYQTLFKVNRNIPPPPLCGDDAFIDFTQQRLYYA